MIILMLLTLSTRCQLQIYDDCQLGVLQAYLHTCDRLEDHQSVIAYSLMRCFYQLSGRVGLPCQDPKFCTANLKGDEWTIYTQFYNHVQCQCALYQSLSEQNNLLHKLNNLHSTSHDSSQLLDDMMSGLVELEQGLMLQAKTLEDLRETLMRDLLGMKELQQQELNKIITFNAKFSDITGALKHSSITKIQQRAQNQLDLVLLHVNSNVLYASLLVVTMLLTYHPRLNSMRTTFSFISFLGWSIELFIQIDLYVYVRFIIFLMILSCGLVSCIKFQDFKSQSITDLQNSQDKMNRLLGGGDFRNILQQQLKHELSLQ